MQKGLRIDADSARVLPADTTGAVNETRVVVDFGEARVDDGHAIGGEILEFDLKREHGNHRVARVGFAVFPD